MKYFELRCVVYLKNDIPFKNSFDAISKYISYSMAQEASLKELHNRECVFKHYNFGNFYPIEKSQVYKKGQSYSFTLRSLDEGFIDSLSKTLIANINNPNFLVVEAYKKSIKQFFISELYSATPVVVSVENGIFWTLEKDRDISKLQKQLHDNLERKYQSFYKEPIKSVQNFIQLFDIKNIKPQSIWTTKKQ